MALTKRYVLDSTELHDQRRLEGAHLRLLVHAQKLLGDRICIPEVVIREYVRHTKERLGQEAARLRGSLHELQRIVGRSVRADEIDVETEVRHWESWLRGHAKALGIEVLPLPATTAEQLMSRDLARRKPFDKDGKGLRDALIWESVLADARGPRDAEIVLVTGNASDFARDGVLHPDLDADLTALGEHRRVVIALGLKAAIATHVDARLPAPDPKVKDALRRAAEPNGGLRAWIASELGAHLERVGLPSGTPVQSLSVTRIKSVRDVRIVEARTIGAEQFAEIEADLTVDLATDQATLSNDPQSSLFIAGRALLAMLMLSDSNVAVRFAITIDSKGVPATVDVWDARWDDNAFKLASLGWSPANFSS